MKNPLTILALGVIVLLFSCNSNRLPKEGIWRGALQLGEQDSPVELPFNFEIKGNTAETITLMIFNAEEQINIKNIKVLDDSIFFQMPVFDSEFKLRFKNKKLEGRWYNYANGPGYFVPFSAVYGVKERFIQETESQYDISGKWEVLFGPERKNPSKAIGQFSQEGNIVKGTFMTETGDYRFLEGIIAANKMMLSCFDGAHSFLFTADIPEKDLMEGKFYTGKRDGSNWRAIKKLNVEIGNPYELTYLNEGYDKIEFSFPDEEGNLVSLDDEEYMGKAIIIQIMGTWCPNCMDETVFLAELYEKYQNQGLEILGLAYEKAKEHENIWRNIRRLKEYSGAKYKFLHSGTSNKRQAAETLPMLNHILSFPTTIFIDRNRDIKKIHTGFTGPGTGETYEQFVKEVTDLVEEML